MSAVPQVSILGLVLFSIFISDIDCGIEYILSKFANGTELRGAADTTEVRDAIQKHLARLEKWVHVNLMRSTRLNARCYTWVRTNLDMCTGF